MSFCRLKSALILFSILFIAGSASAQGIPTTIGGLELTPSNPNPAPGQELTITARSYSIDINSATLTWTVNGATVEKGVGSTMITVKAPALGKSLNIQVTAITPDGISFENTLTLSSGAVDMIIETNGYKPPLFQGKLPVTYQNTVKIVAVPHLANSAGAEYDPKTLVYRWEQSGNALESQSGYGKQSIIMPGTLVPRPYVMMVTVSTRDGSAQGVGIVSINPASPSVAFYKNDPLYGPLYNLAVSDTMYLGSQRETGVVAVPLGFNMTGTGNGNLDFVWSINKRERPELAGNRTITLRAPEGAGSSDIKLSIRHKSNILQSATDSFRSIFSATATSSRSSF